MINTRTRFSNANEAFEYFLDKLRINGIERQGTKVIDNVGFYIENPLDNEITNEERKWSLEYAEAEWQWYLSGDRNISELERIYGKVPKIWQSMANVNGDVNSNYGWQWNRNDQIDYVVAELKSNPMSRRAVISIYDAKEWPQYRKDTPCTLAIHFQIAFGRLNMSVMMRSNDLWFGFAIDQYCFSRLQEMIAERLNIEVGNYYHFATNLHLYERHY